MIHVNSLVKEYLEYNNILWILLTILYKLWIVDLKYVVSFDQTFHPLHTLLHTLWRHDGTILKCLLVQKANAYYCNPVLKLFMLLQIVWQYVPMIGLIN